MFLWGRNYNPTATDKLAFFTAPDSSTKTVLFTRTKYL